MSESRRGRRNLHVERIISVFLRVEALRAKRRELGDWPSWCFMPVALAEKIMGKGLPLHAPEQYKHTTFLAALAAWRSTQGIYRFDPSTFDALW